MPYGVDKKMGGDNESNTKWMEKCVDSVMNSGKDKSSAIAICKAQLKRKKDSNSEFIGVDIDIINREYMKRQNFIKHLRDGKLITFAQADAEYQAFLARTDFEL